MYKRQLHAGWVGITGLYRAKYRVYIAVYRYRAYIRDIGPVPVYGLYIGKYRGIQGLHMLCRPCISPVFAYVRPIYRYRA